MSAGSNMKFGACAPLGAAVKPQVAQRTVQILLVEDDNAHAELTRRALVECRVLNQLESTTSGEAAIQRLRDPRQTLPDLVLLDTSLPGISGLKVLEAIRNEPRTAHLPVIMLTDAHDEATISAGYRADVKSFITKPVTAGDFREALQGIESFWLSIVLPHTAQIRSLHDGHHDTNDPSRNARARANAPLSALPNADANAAAAANAPGRSAAPERGGTRVLLVEDNPPDAALVRQFLSRAADERYEVIEVHSAAAAEQALEEAHFDIVLLDLVLPDCAGEDTLNRFLSRPTDTTIVVLTGLDSEDMGERAVALGAQDFVVKGNHDHHAFLRIIRYARERAQAADTLVRAQRVDTVAQMAGSIAHDFNNMLQVILGHTEILREGVSRQANLTHSVEAVSDAAERAMRFTRQLLSFRTQRSSGMSVIDVDACLHALQPLLERILGEHITLVIDTRSEGSSIRAEAQIVEQMVVNLALNARAAMRNGGRLIVRSCRRPDPRRGEEAICIEVTDTGCGMPTAVQARAFEPFYTTRATGEGSGLGLSSTLSLARQFGGDVSLTSEEHRGTTVQIFLPEFVAHDSAPAEVPAARAASPCAQQTILYVDDEPMVVGIVRTMLTRAGFRCLAAEGPDPARALFAAHADEIDLIIRHVIMPGTNGPTLCAELLARRPDLPVIYVSGFVDDPVLADSLNDSDRQRLVEKPFTPAKLLQTVSAMLPLREGVPASQSGA